MRIARRIREGGLRLPYQRAWSPLTQLNKLREEINRIFEEPAGPMVPATGFFEGWNPTLDVFEDQDNLVVKAELPGMKKDELDISLTGEILTISGERKREEKSKNGDSYRSERSFGRFHRSVTLPRPVDPNKVQATYQDGILTITLPKSEEAKRKQIEVKIS